MLHHRIIAHIDLDAFYTQVEHKRLGISRDLPLAVQQWEGLIAINYPSRAKGITRHMRVPEAMKICPDLICVHVETLGSQGDDSSAGPVDQTRQKASLERYRKESKLILKLISDLAGPLCVTEKGGLDELFIDLTDRVDDELGKRPLPPASLPASCSVVGGPLNPALYGSDARLMVAAEVISSIRAGLWATLEYRCSAGIAHNKILSKLGSARFKPDQQVVVTPRGVEEFMRDIRLEKIRGFGGKLGEQLEAMALGVKTAGEAQGLSMDTLAKVFGQDKAQFVFQSVRGVCNEPVKPKRLTKSFMAAKSFPVRCRHAMLLLVICFSA